MGDGERSHTLIYDGECRICRRSVEWVRSADREGRLELIPYQDPRVRECFPEVPSTEMEAAMQLISHGSRRRQGAEAAEQVIALLPGWRVLAPFFRIPGVRRLAAVVYRAVARNRRRLGCGDHCAVPLATGEGAVVGADGADPTEKASD
jgi:predicted DCC family thiol-disulfide oxidoreductase YuxK